MAADGGLYLGGDPMLELLCRRKLRGENEGVKARLVDDGFVWVSLNTVTNHYGILFPNWVVICHPILSSSSTCAFKAFIANAPQQRGRGLSPSYQLSYAEGYPPFRHPLLPGNLTERIVHPGQHGVPFRYPILTRLNNVSIQLAMALYSMINWHS